MSKSGQKKAVGKQFSYEMETEETRKGIDGSKKGEWEKWQKFMAGRPVEGDEPKQLLNEGQKPISTQWIDTDKHLHLKRPGQPQTVKYESRQGGSREDVGNQDRQRTSRPRQYQDDIGLGSIREAENVTGHHKCKFSW